MARSAPSGWDYHFKFQTPQLTNYLVCRYKVVLDDSRAVRRVVPPPMPGPAAALSAAGSRTSP
ncbi:hypothetical protein GmRootV35_13870 [Variovorax sp. V35]